MNDEASEGKAPVSDYGRVWRLLVDAGQQIEPGTLWSYSDMSAAAETEITTGSDRRLQRALEVLRNDHQVAFAVEPGVGYWRLDSEGVVTHAPKQRKKVERAADRAMSRLECADYEELSPAAKKKHTSELSILAMTKVLHSKLAVLAVEQRVETAKGKVDFSAVMKLFQPSGDAVVEEARDE